MSLPPLPPEILQQMNEGAGDLRQRIMSEIAAYLADAPLYRTYRYSGNLWDWAKIGLAVTFPSTIRLHCPDGECLRAQLWDGSGLTVSNGRNTPEAHFFKTLRYQCRNCQRSDVTFVVLVNLLENEGEIKKIGQFPPLWREADPLVVAGWNKHDVLLYRKAMTFRNANEGIAALPYLRRIIENHTRDVLDLIADSNSRTPIEGFDRTTFDQARMSRRFSDKLDFAQKYLPTGLTPQGQPNPIGVLYELISEGLHERNEDECVEIFDRCRAAFEFVVRKLTEAKREDEDYARALRKLNS
jgi:hypothetical protein